MTDLIKQDITFLEYSLWWIQQGCTTEQGEFVWKDREGFIYKTNRQLPTKVDMIFLYFFLLNSQNNEWVQEFEFSQYRVLCDCGITPSKHWRERLQDSLNRWSSVELTFQGTFYDGRSYQSMLFRIIEAWTLDAETNKLYIRFSPEWLARIRESTYFKILNFEDLKLFRSPLAMRLYEILIKSFQGRNVWQIGTQKLAAKIPMSEEYPAHIIPKIQTAVSRINEKTDLQLRLEIQRPKRGKALLVFHKVQEGEVLESIQVTEISEEERGVLEELLLLLPEKERAKKTLIKGIEKNLIRKGREYVERNILYANAHAKKSYRVYLLNALTKDWGAEWWEDEQAKREEESQEIEANSLEKEQEEESTIAFQKKMDEDLEWRLAQAKEEFLLTNDQNELELWKERAYGAVEKQMPKASEREKENYRREQFISYLQRFK